MNINEHRCVTATEETQRHATLLSFPVFSFQTLGTPHAMFSRGEIGNQGIKDRFCTQSQCNDMLGLEVLIWCSEEITARESGPVTSIR